MRRVLLGLLMATPLGVLPWAQAQDPTTRDYADFTHRPAEDYPLWTAPAGSSVALASAGEADLVLDEGDLVLGVVVGGEARAYPTGYFWGPQHEILNDVLGGTPIAPSW
jgi:hypothetical protein